MNNMSTIDLTKVAGFKAVDAEGNDMGIVSISEMTNMVKESIIQEAVAMQSVSTLAETSTLAATDTYEDKLDISDTFSYVRTLDSSGNPKRTSQNALATVVGGLLSSQKLYPFMDRGDVSDFNQATDAGTYKVSDVTSNIPIGAYNYGVLHVGVATNLVSQLYIPDDNSLFDYKIFVRIRFGESWRRWRGISIPYI